MSFAVTVKDAQDLRRLIPLNILSANRFEELCSKTGIEEVARGSVLFNQGDAKNEFVYVLSGTVSLQAGGIEMETITGGTESARFALAHQIPRKVSAIAKDRVRYIRVDAVYVNQPNDKASGTVATYEVSDIPSDAADDWVTTLLKSPIFQRLPPANLQNILSLLEEVAVRAGQEIIHQDEPGDYYYVIKRGRCALTRKPSRLAREVKLAELKTNDTFGEDSLISDQPRNVTVTMMTDGILLRLSKANFLKLVKDPVISFVNMETAKRMIPQEARWLDVRAPDSFEEGHLPGAVNIPFFRLRMELANLSHQFKYILLCETGKVSEAAAFLLIRHEIEAFVLKGGVSGIFKDQLVTGGEKPALGAGPITEMPLIHPDRAASGQGVSLEFEAAHAVPREIEFTAVSKQPERAAVDLHAIKSDMASLRGSLLELQGEAASVQEAESRMREQVQSADARLEDAIGRLEDLKADVARFRAPGHAPAVSADIVEGLQKQLAEVRADGDKLERQLQTALRDADEQRNALEVNGRKALSEAQAERLEVEKVLANAKAENQVLRDQVQQLQTSAAVSDSAHHAQVSTSASDLAQLRQENHQVLERNRELELQIAELSSLVQEFVEQQGQQEAGDGDSVDALKTELEMVRSQAEHDVIVMQRKLRDTEQEASRLRSELDTAQQRLLLGEISSAKMDGRDKGGSGGRGLWIAALFGMLILGAAVVIAIATSTHAGRDLARNLIAPPVPTESPAVSP